MGEFVFGGTLLRALCLGLAAFALLWVVMCVLLAWARREQDED